VDFERVRRLAITALFSDDTLLDLLVLKGGNAISLVYRCSSRASLDLDFSIEGDFLDLADIQRRVFKALNEHFSSVGLAIFDGKFEQRPANPADDQADDWGGYRVSFKLIDHKRYAGLSGDIDAIRREALEVGPSHLRTLAVDISKFEYCKQKRATELDDYAIYVYSPSMIAFEKLRAICQQMPEYALRRGKRARARDFFDIHELVVNAHVRFTGIESLELVKNIFAAKCVPVGLIERIPRQREFHRPDWAAVQASVRGELKDFDYYFDFVIEQAKPLEALWVV